MLKKLVDKFNKPQELSFNDIVEKAVEQRNSAMKIFINSKNQLTEANDTIVETQKQVAEALSDLKETQKLLEENKDFNIKLINNIDKIME